jgi:hypothetical protein
MRVVATAVAVASVLVASSCASSGATETSTNLVHTAVTPIAEIAQVSINNAVRVARASNPRLFSIFPALPGKRRCAIPEGGPRPSSVRGTCRTSFRPNPVTQAPEWIVTFAERWLIPACAPDLDVACRHPWRLHVWRITEVGSIPTSGKLQVESSRSSGATAPQDYQ